MSEAEIDDRTVYLSPAAGDGLQSDPGSFHTSESCAGRGMFHRHQDKRRFEPKDLSTVREVYLEKAVKEGFSNCGICAADVEHDFEAANYPPRAETVLADGGVVADDQPSYDIQVHRRARDELNKLPDHPAEQLRQRITAASKQPEPSNHPKVQHLGHGEGLLGVRAEGARAIIRVEKPDLLVLLVDKRRRVYDRIDVAQDREAAWEEAA